MKRLLIPLFLAIFILSLMLGCRFVPEEADTPADADNIGDVSEEPKEEEPEHVHLYESAITDPTEDSKGYTTHTCECGDKYVDTYVDKLPPSLRFDSVYRGGDVVGYSVSAYTGKQYVDVVVPATHEGKPVLSVKANGFANSTSLKSIELPEGVTSIGNSAFSGCKNLKSINMPDSLETIDDYAFYQCGALESVTFSEESVLNRMGVLVFAYSGIKNITVPSSLTSCGNGIFEGCNSLGYNEYSNALYVGNSVNPYVILVKAKDTDIASCEIYDGTKIILNSAFINCTRLTDIVIPDSVLIIQTYAFYKSGLRSITVGKSLSLIEDFAFDECYSLLEIIDHSHNLSFEPSAEEANGGIARYALDVHDGESKIVVDGGYLFYTAEGKSYLVGTTLTDSELVLPTKYNDEDYAVYHHAFYLNDTLTSVEMVGGITEIGASAFAKCTALSSVTLSEGIASLGERIFSECTSLESIAVPNSVNTIYGYAFLGCSSLASVSLGDSLDVLRGGAFTECTSLVSVVIPAGVTEISHLFTDCTSLERVELPEGLKAIKWRCFENCTSLAEIELPSTLEEIGERAFSGCTSLKAIELPCALSAIGTLAFAYSSIESVVMPDSVLTVGEEAFRECAALTSAVISNSVTVLEASLFAHCKSLLEIVIPDSVTTSDRYVFTGCTALVRVELSNRITELGEYMFKDCISLVSVVVPASVEKIGTYAFYGCTSLTSIEFKCEEDAYTGHSILLGCTSLQNVTLWNGLKTVDNYFFGECTSLVSVVLPGTVTKISSNVFYLCESLESIYYLGTAEEWANVKLADKTEYFVNADIYFYSEDEPAEEGNYWHYSESGEVVVW